MAAALPPRPPLRKHPHLPQVPTALSTPEGLPWITRSPWRAQLLIKASSSSVHLKGKKMTPTHSRNQQAPSDGEVGQRPWATQKQRGPYQAPGCCRKPQHRESPPCAASFQRGAGIALHSAQRHSGLFGTASGEGGSKIRGKILALAW